MKKAIIGKKVGMSQIFDEAGKVIPVTIIEAGPCVVVQKMTEEKEGYKAVQLGFEEVAEKKLSQPEQGHLKKAGVGMMKNLKEFRLEDDSKLEVGDIVKAAEEKFELFHLFLDDGFGKAKNIVSLLPGHTMVIRTDEIDCIPEIVISTIQMTEGMTLEETIKQWPEAKLPVVKRALSELTIKSKKKGLFF